MKMINLLLFIHFLYALNKSIQLKSDLFIEEFDQFLFTFNIFLIIKHYILLNNNQLSINNNHNLLWSYLNHSIYQLIQSKNDLDLQYLKFLGKIKNLKKFIIIINLKFYLLD